MSQQDMLGNLLLQAATNTEQAVHMNLEFLRQQEMSRMLLENLFRNSNGFPPPAHKSGPETFDDLRGIL